MIAIRNKKSNTISICDVKIRKKREADPLSVLDILTMDATVLVGALLDQNLDHYGRK